MMHFDMSETNQVSSMAYKQYAYGQDEIGSMSSVSSIGYNNSFDSSVFDEDYNLKPNENGQISRTSPTTVILDARESLNVSTLIALIVMRLTIQMFHWFQSLLSTILMLSASVAPGSKTPNDPRLELALEGLVALRQSIC